jgi:hypothetical protein
LSPAKTATTINNRAGRTKNLFMIPFLVMELVTKLK